MIRNAMEWLENRTKSEEKTRKWWNWWMKNGKKITCYRNSLDSYYRNCMGGQDLVWCRLRFTLCQTMPVTLSSSSCIFNSTLRIVRDFCVDGGENPYSSWSSLPSVTQKLRNHPFSYYTYIVSTFGENLICLIVWWVCSKRCKISKSMILIFMSFTLNNDLYSK